MKVFGYQKDTENLIELQEVSILSNIKELDRIIEFLKDIKEKHNNLVGKTELCHSHYRDWDAEWKIGTPDIIVVTSIED